MVGNEIFAFNALLILVAVGLFVGVGLPCAIRSEKRGFNNGICPICGKKLEHFDDDSQGGRGYCCPSTTHNYFTWVSYRFIDKNFGKQWNKYEYPKVYQIN